MESKKIEFSDEMRVKDSFGPSPAPAKGIIRIYDKKGNLVSETHNTIVESGRRFLFDRFLSSRPMTTDATLLKTTTTSLTDNYNYTDYKFGKIHFVFETSPAMTTSSTKISDITASDKRSFDITSISISEKDLKVTISESLSASANFMKFNEIYITIVDSAGTTEVLFSRALIDPLYIGEDTSYDMEYSFYF